MSKLGQQTWDFTSGSIYIQGMGTVAGKLEGEGPLGQQFDVCLQNDRIDGDTWEHSEQRMFGRAAHIALQNAKLDADQIDFLLGADLNAQLIGFYLGLRSYFIPALGVYSACASICEALALASVMIDTGHAKRVLVGTSSHTSTAERQFRYPTEYGVQTPPTAQRTVTGSGVAILSDTQTKIQITHATIGKVLDYGVTSPWEMGVATAPAAADTLITHLRDTNRQFEDYDCIATGDLGRVGHNILRELLKDKGFHHTEHLTDCGMLVYHPSQTEVFSGGSGGACCTIVTFSHLLKKLMDGTWKRILVSATGALFSSVSAQQQDSIPSVSHAIVFERKDTV